MGLKNNFSRCRIAIYLDRFQRIMPNLQSLFDVSSSVRSGNERKGRSYMDKVAYNCTLSYGTCESFGSIYPFCINVYDISYFPVPRIKDLINKDGNATTPFKLATGTKPSVSHLRVLFFHVLYGKLLHTLTERR